MDCVDRDDLIKNLNTFAPECYNALINDLIMKQPAVDVAPDKAYLISPDYCPICGIHLEETSKIVTNEDGDVAYYQFQPNFCANCGADMRGSE